MTKPFLPLLAMILACTQLAATAAERPNVVLIMTDDQGYGDLSITGNQAIQTPNMDRIGSEGACSVVAASAGG